MACNPATCDHMGYVMCFVLIFIFIQRIAEYNYISFVEHYNNFDQWKNMLIRMAKKNAEIKREQNNDESNGNHV